MNWKEFLTVDLGAAALIESLSEFVIKPWLHEHGPDAMHKVMSSALSLDECRAELFMFYRKVAGRDVTASQAFFRRQGERQRCANRSYGAREQYRHGDENTYIGILSKFWKDTDGNQASRNLRERVLIWIQRLPDQQHDETLEALNHDPIQQLLRRAWQSFNGGARTTALVMARARREAHRTWLARHGSHARQSFWMRLIRG